MTQVRKKVPAVLLAGLVAAALALAMGVVTAQSVYAENSDASDDSGDYEGWPLYVGDVQVGPGHTSGAGWVYEGDAAGGTLTLTNATIEATSWEKEAIMATDMDLTIELIGVNTVNGVQSQYIPGPAIVVYRANNGSLTIVGPGELEVNGWIHAGGDIAIKNAKVTVNSRFYPAISANLMVGMDSVSPQRSSTVGDIRMTNSDVSAAGGLAGILARGTISFNNKSGGKYTTSVQARAEGFVPPSSDLGPQAADPSVYPAVAATEVSINDDLIIVEPAGGTVKKTEDGGTDMETIYDGDKVAQNVRIEPEKKPEPPKPANNVSGVLLAKMTAKGGKGLKVSWTKMEGVDGYDIFLSKCNVNDKVFKPQLIHTVSGNKSFSWTKSGLKKRIPYKVRVKAWTMKDGKKTYVKSSPIVHAFTSNGSKGYTNAKSVKVKKTKVSMSPGQTSRIKAKVKKVKAGKRLISKLHAPKLRYLSSDPKIASVNGSGKITAKAAGSCTIYVYAPNGVYKKVSVTVQ